MHQEFTYRYAWPSGDWGSFQWKVELKLHLNLIWKNQMILKDLLKEIEERMEMVRSPFRTAESFLAEEIIDPRDTRRLLCEFANLSSTFRTPGKTSFGLRP